MHEIVARTGDISIFYWTLLLDCKYSHNFYSHAAEHGHFHLIEHGLQLEIPLKPEKAIISAARYGNLGMIEFFRAKNNGYWPSGVLDAAATNGHWDLLKWLYGAGCRVWRDVKVGLVVAEKGNLELLIWMMENKIHIHKESAKHAAKAGHFEVVKWLCEHTMVETRFLASNALDGGHLHIFDWLISYAFINKEDTCSSAVKLGIDVLEFARSMGFSWDQCAYWYAIEAGDLEIVKWLHINKCPKTFQNDASSLVCQNAARLGQLEILKFFHSVCEPDCDWFSNYGIGRCAVIYGQISVLKWIKDISSPKKMTNKRKNSRWNEKWKFAEIAAYYGQLEILQWLLENGYSWNSNLCAIAATQGYVNILQWADENGYKWDRKKASYTEIPGPYKEPIELTPEPHAEALKLLENFHECPWDLSLSDKNLYKKVVRFAQDSGCPWNGNIPARSNEILDWLEKKKWCNFNSKTLIHIFDESEAESETDSSNDSELELMEGVTFPDDEDDFNDEICQEAYYTPDDCALYEYE